tara:strand:+ start:624 stop:1148 length:525 start_codon:yes stop_codon:yes gene_type:complete
MAFKLSDGTIIPIDVAFSIGDINYPANWLRLSSSDEKTAVGISEVADDPIYDQRFYNTDGTAKQINDVTETKNGEEITTPGLKSNFKVQEKEIAKSLLNLYDWQVIRKSEKNIEMDSNVIAFRDAIRTAYTTRKTEIDNCADVAALVTLYSSTEQSDGTYKPNMTQYPLDPNSY